MSIQPGGPQQGGTRSGPARVLQELAGAGTPLTLAGLRERTGLHENTLRGHLGQLLREERVTRVPVRSGGRGRPAWAYAARESEYAALSLALAEALDRPQAQRDGQEPVRQEPVRQGGRAWGERLVTALGPAADVDPRRRLLLALEHTGFAPEADGDTVRLRRCPLLDAASQHPSVVCDVHRGLIDGVLGETGAALLPFAEPGACLVRLP